MTLFHVCNHQMVFLQYLYLKSVTDFVVWLINMYHSTITVTDFSYKYCRKPSDDGRHEAQRHGYLLLLITSYIYHIALLHIILSTLTEIANNGITFLKYILNVNKFPRQETFQSWFVVCRMNYNYARYINLR